MNKQTKMLLGLAAVAGVGYYIWKKNKPDTKANLLGNDACMQAKRGSGGCRAKGPNKMGGMEQCMDGSWCISKVTR